MPYKEPAKHAAYLKQWKKDRDYDRKWKEDHKEHVSSYHKDWMAKHPKYNSKYCRKWRDKNPGKDHNKEHQIAYRNISLLPFCELCPEDNIQAATQRHHPDYNYPLIIVSCCRICHKWVKIPIDNEV